MAILKALRWVLVLLMLLDTGLFLCHAVKQCPRDTVKFGVCGSWLGLVDEVIGTPPSQECCSLVKGLADFEAAVCLCTALVGFAPVKVPVALTLLLNSCAKTLPEGFLC